MSVGMSGFGVIMEKIFSENKKMKITVTNNILPQNVPEPSAGEIKAQREDCPMKIIVNDHIKLENAPARFAGVIRERLTIENPAYSEAVKRNRWTGKIPKELRFYQDTPEGLTVPRGFAVQLLRMTTKHEVSWQIEDRRRTWPAVNFAFAGKLRDYQVEACTDVLKHEFGVLHAPTGSGKTTIALAVIAKRKQPALVIVHTKELLQQWIDRASQFLNMAPDEIGIVGNGEKRIGERLTIGIVNSIYPIASEIAEHFGFLIVDECHHCPRRTFTEALSAFDCRYQLGLSATPYRRDGLSRLINYSLGEQVHAVDKNRLIENGSILKPEIVTRRTGFESSFNLTAEYSKGISELTRNPERNGMIILDVTEFLRDNSGPVLVLSDRKAHCEDLAGMLIDQGIKTEILTGELATGKRKDAVERIVSGEVQAVCATGSLVGEGFDLPALSALFMATPLKFGGRLLQYVGRILRPAPGKDRATVFDYVDSREPVLAASARARMKVYEAA